ncbi:MAG: Glu/Leu/Phe/Val dehydrogenase [Acidimicrobiia bacterium]
MDVFRALEREDHERVVFGFDSRTGLRAIIAIHSTARGPALGGTRFYPYRSEEGALDDALDLARAMTLKSAAAELPLGGGKAVIMGDPAQDKTEALLEAYGRFVDKLGGSYLTAEDVGTTVKDMKVVRTQTPYVTGLPVKDGGSGDPSPATAVGVMAAMKVVAERLWENSELGELRIAVQGVGKVGSALVELLIEGGAEVTVGDIDGAALDAVSARGNVSVLPAEEILFARCDILAPCALGGVLNPQTIPGLQCQAIVGAANNQLSSPSDTDELAARDILYAPDFIVNAGGIINIAEELNEYSWERAQSRISAIGETTRQILDLAERDQVSAHAAAVSYAQRHLHPPDAVS